MSLDYASIRNCLKVTREWNEVFFEESFRAKIASKFSTQMWMDTDNFERKAWKTNKNILAWTANSEEIAYVEGQECDDVYSEVDDDKNDYSDVIDDIKDGYSEVEDEKDISEIEDDDEKYHLIIHFINQNGELRSRKIEGMSSRCNIWILHNIILVKVDSKLYAITKLGLKQSTIKSFSKRIRGWTTNFTSTVGVRFLYYISGDDLPQDITTLY